MQINAVPSKQGSQWVVEGFKLVKAQPLQLFALTFLYLICLFMCAVIPGVGQIAPLLISPLLSVGFMHGVRAVAQGQVAKPTMLFQGFNDGEGKAWRGLLLLGLVNAVVTSLGLFIAALFDDGTLLKLVTGSLKADDPALKSPTGLFTGFATFLLVYVPLQMALWYAPFFMAWHKMGLAQSLFSSFWAVKQNKGAFFRYALTWFGVTVMASMALQVLRVAVPSQMVMSIVLTPLSTILFAAVYSSFWPSYRDAIGKDDQTADAEQR